MSERSLECFDEPFNVPKNLNRWSSLTRCVMRLLYPQITRRCGDYQQQHQYTAPPSNRTPTYLLDQELLSFSVSEFTLIGHCKPHT